MSTMTIKEMICPRCGTISAIDSSANSDTYFCSHCQQLYNSNQWKDVEQTHTFTLPTKPSVQVNLPPSPKVTITDIEIPFLSVLTLVCKVFISSGIVTLVGYLADKLL